MSPSRASLPAFSGRLRLRLLGLAAFCATAARAQAEIYNVTVTAPDPSLNYTGKWTDVDNGGHRFSAEAGCSVSLLFQGTAIYWYSDIDPRGGIGQVMLDGGSRTIVDLSQNATADQTPVSALMFAREGLDQSHQHNITLSWVGPGKLGGSYFSFYYFEYTPLGSAAASSITASGTGVQTTTAPASSTASTTAAPSGGGGGSKGALIGGIAGGVVAGVVAGALLILLAFCVRRRRRRARQRQTAVIDERATRPYDLASPTTVRASELEDKSSFAPSSPPATATAHAPSSSYTPPILPAERRSTRSPTLALSEVLDLRSPASAHEPDAHAETTRGVAQHEMQQRTYPPISAKEAAIASPSAPPATTLAESAPRDVGHVAQPPEPSLAVSPHVWRESVSTSRDEPPPAYIERPR